MPFPALFNKLLNGGLNIAADTYTSYTQSRMNTHATNGVQHVRMFIWPGRKLGWSGNSGGNPGSGINFNTGHTGEAKAVVNLAKAAGLPVILNFVGGNNKPSFYEQNPGTTNLNIWIANWFRPLCQWILANGWGPDEVIIELLNEGFYSGGAAGDNLYWSHQGQIHASIRDELPNHYICCMSNGRGAPTPNSEGSEWSFAYTLTNKTPYTDALENGTIYSIHNYMRFSFTHQQVSEAAPTDQAYEGVSSHTNLVVPVFDDVAEWADGNGVFVVCDEFGCAHSSALDSTKTPPNGPIIAGGSNPTTADRGLYDGVMRQACEDRNLGWTLWVDAEKPSGRGWFGAAADLSSAIDDAILEGCTWGVYQDGDLTLPGPTPPTQNALAEFHSKGGGDEGFNPGTLTWTHSIGGNNRLIELWVTQGVDIGGGQTRSAISTPPTVDGEDMTLLKRINHPSSAAHGAERWYKVAPALSTVDIVVTVPEGRWIGNTFLYENVDQTTPYRDLTEAGSTGTVDVNAADTATYATGDLVTFGLLRDKQVGATLNTGVSRDARTSSTFLSMNWGDHDEASVSYTLAFSEEWILHAAAIRGVAPLATSTPTFDAVGAGAEGLSPGSLNWSHTFAGDDRYAWVVVAIDDGGAPPADAATNVTIGGQACTKIGRVLEVVDTHHALEVFQLINPPSGTQTVSLTTPTGRIAATSISLENVYQTSPLRDATETGAQSVGTAVSDTATSSEDDLILWAVLSDADVTVTPDGTEDAKDTVLSGNGLRVTVGIKAAAASSTDVDFTLSGAEQWCAIAFGIKGPSVMPEGRIFGKLIGGGGLVGQGGGLIG